MNLLEAFKSFLFSQGTKPSKVTVKNYISDINHFIRWYESRFQKPFPPSEIKKQILDDYKTQSLEVFSQSSLERHLSALRKFFTFLKLEGKISYSPFEQIKSETALDADPWHIKDFKSYLYVYNASHLTIKNYLIDIKQFLNWAEEVTTSNVASGGADVLNHINLRLIEEYKQRLRDLGSLTPATINRKLSSLRKYVVWAEAENLIKPFEAGIENIEEKRQVPLYLPEEEFSFSKHAKFPSSYSKFPPFRLFQKVTKAAIFAVDTSLIEYIVRLIEKIQYSVWKRKGQPVFEASKRIRIPKQVSHTDILGIKNISKELYAPLDISTKNFPLHKKVWFTLRHTRPNWYRTYHSYAIVHYFHFAVLVIFVVGLAFGFYNAFVQKPSGQNPALAATAPPRVLSFQ